MKAHKRRSFIKVIITVLILQIFLFAVSIVMVYLRFPVSLTGLVEKTSDLIGYEMNMVAPPESLEEYIEGRMEDQKYYQIRQTMTDIMMEDENLHRLRILWIDEDGKMSCLYDTVIPEDKNPEEEFSVFNETVLEMQDSVAGDKVPAPIVTRENSLRIVRAFTYLGSGTHGSSYLITDVWADGFRYDVMDHYVAIVIWLLVMTIALAVISIMVCYHSVTKPMDQLAEAVRDYMSEGYAERSRKPIENVKTKGCDEVENLKQAILKMSSDMDGYIDRLKKKTWESEHDAMTTLANRAKYFVRLNDEYSKLQSALVIYLDVNNLRNLNEVYGHTIGDSVIMKVAEKLRQIRSEKVNVYRWNGDEFLIIMCDYEEADAKVLFQSWYSHIGNLNRSSDTVQCTLAYGMAYASGEIVLDTLIRSADEAMCKNKIKQKKLMRAVEGGKAADTGADSKPET